LPSRRQDLVEAILITGHPIANATATSAASVPGPPTIDRPTGKPLTTAPGMLTCGTPVSPPWAHRQRIRSRWKPAAERGSARLGGVNGRGGKERILPGGRRGGVAE